MKAPARHFLILAVAVAGASPLIAFAHAFLDHADPKVGSQVEVAPTEVKVWFTEDLEPAFSSIQVLDANGKQVDGKDFHLDAKDKKLAIVSLPPLAAGTYKVVWQVVSTDTHKTQGSFTFTAKNPASPSTSHPSTQPSTGPSAPPQSRAS